MGSIGEKNSNITLPSMDNYNEDAFISAMQISSKMVLSLVLKAALDLNLLQLIKKAGASASASELAAQLPTTNPEAASMIDRILRLLAAHSVLFSSLKKLPNGAGVERHYSLAPLCKYLSAGNDRDGGCAGPLPLRISGEEHDQDAYLFAMQLASDSVLPTVLETAMELGLFEVMKRAGLGASVSASELAVVLPTGNNPDSANVIERSLRLLAEHSVVIRSLKTLPDVAVESRYSLTPVCNYLTREDEGSEAFMYAALQQKVLLESWYHLKDAVLEGGIPFEKAAGTTIFEYVSKNPRANYMFNRCMAEHTAVFMNKLLQKYKGFEGLKSLVDVGGGIGSTISKIVSKYPSIKGINFDLPHVIQNALSYPGVEHIAGDMFVSIPTADAIFMKLVCHDWSDAHCEKILKKCYETLPANGKVIIADQILADDPNSGRALIGESRGDLNMLVYGLGGKERTEKEFQILAKQAGFRKFHKVCCAFGLWVMELYK